MNLKLFTVSFAAAQGMYGYVCGLAHATLPAGYMVLVTLIPWLFAAVLFSIVCCRRRRWVLQCHHELPLSALWQQQQSFLVLFAFAELLQLAIAGAFLLAFGPAAITDVYIILYAVIHGVGMALVCITCGLRCSWKRPRSKYARQKVVIS